MTSLNTIKDIDKKIEQLENELNQHTDMAQATQGRPERYIRFKYNSALIEQLDVLVELKKELLTNNKDCF